MPSSHDLDNSEHHEASNAKRILIVDEEGNVIGSLPISASSLPLPTNAAQETDGNLASIKTKTDNLDLAITALRDALRGTNSKTLSDIVTALASVAVTNAGTFAVQNTPAVPSGLTFKCAQYTSAQTGVALWTPASGKKVTIVAIQIQAAGTTAGTAQVWFGASGDTTYTRGTDAPIFDGEFAPSSTLKPGYGQKGLWQGAADYILRVTTSAAMTITITVWGYEA